MVIRRLRHEAMPDWSAGALNAGRGRVALCADTAGAVVGRYRGVVQVVGRGRLRSGSVHDGQLQDGLRVSPSAKGPWAVLIDIAFHAARQADPERPLGPGGLRPARYDDETWMVEKRGTTLALLRDLLRRNVPIPGLLALQGRRWGIDRQLSGKALRYFLAAVSDSGLRIPIRRARCRRSECPWAAPGSRSDGGRHLRPVSIDSPWLIARLRSVVTWGLTDRYTSKSAFFPRDGRGPSACPLPFRLRSATQGGGLRHGAGLRGWLRR